MLLTAKKLGDLSFSQLMEVYIEGNRQRGCSLLEAEQEFYDYLSQVFFSIPGAVYYVWEEGGSYVSALRLEPYRDGLLLEVLETAPQCRCRGYARRLIREVQALYPDAVLYSHVHKHNRASLAVHGSCGFQKTLDYARCIDGSVLRTSVTLKWGKR